MGSPLLFSFWDDFGQDTHILLKMGQRGHGGWEWRLKFKSIFNLRKCSLAACLKCFTTKADLIVTKLLSACCHHQNCHHRHRDDYMMIYHLYLEQVWELLSFRGSVKDALLKINIVHQGHFFKRMHWKFERNISCWMFMQKDNSGTWMSLLCYAIDMWLCVCVCVCVCLLFVCLFTFCFLFDWVLDWWSAVCRHNKTHTHT